LEIEPPSAFLSNSFAHSGAPAPPTQTNEMKRVHHAN
jgi:hypothetical protein